MRLSDARPGQRGTVEWDGNRLVAAVTDRWDEPLDEVHDIPQIVDAILASGWLTAHDAEQRERIAKQVEDYWDACGELIDTNNGARLAFEAVAAQIRESGGTENG